MATVNNRVKKPQATTINGVDNGGKMSCRITQGYGSIVESDPDGLGGPPIRDKEAEYTRGTIVTQDWVHIIELITGTVGTYVFYEQKSGAPEATGYIKHTIVNPVIHRVNFTLTQKGYSIVAAEFECKAADETKGMLDMWTQEDDQAKPSYISAERGGYRVKATSFDPDGVAPAINIYHVKSFSLAIALIMQAEFNDGDVGFTCVDVEEDGARYSGSLGFQDSSISTSLLLAQRIVTAGRGTLTMTVAMSGGASDKTITIAGVDPDGFERSSGKDFTEHTVNFGIANDPDTPLTLSGANKILTVA